MLWDSHSRFVIGKIPSNLGLRVVLETLEQSGTVM